MFELHEKSRGNMKSCKLDKNRGVYTPGKHVPSKYNNTYMPMRLVSCTIWLCV